MQTKRASFQLFTYQIHAVKQPGFLIDEGLSRYGLGHSSTMADVLKKKNLIFKNCILEAGTFVHPQRTNAEIIKRNVAERDGFFLVRVGIGKKTRLPNRELEDEEHPYFPNVFACFDNNPAEQMVAIQNDTGVFTSPKVVAKMFEAGANRKLSLFYLECVILPQFDEHDFWDYVKRHRNKITGLQFSIMAPNLPRISASVPEAFKKLQQDLSSHSAKLEISSAAHSHLTIDQDNEDIGGLAKAAADGGGEIKIRLIGFKRMKSMSKTTKEVSVEEFNAEGKPTDILKTISELFNE